MHARIYKIGCSFWDQVTTKDLGSSMMRKLEIGVSRNMNLSGIVTMILGAMYAGVLVSLIVGQLHSCEGMPCTFPLSFRVKFGALGPSWDLWAKSVSELQLEVEQIQLDAIGWLQFVWSLYHDPRILVGSFEFLVCEVLGFSNKINCRRGENSKVSPSSARPRIAMHCVLRF